MSTNENIQQVVIVPHGNPQNTSQEVQSSYVPPETPKPLVKFFQGEPEVLGVTQLVIGINHIFFGIIITIISSKRYHYAELPLVNTGVLFWSGIMYVISGSLSIAAFHKPTVGKVKASLVLNIISCIAATISVAIFSFFFSFLPRYRYYNSVDVHCAYYPPSQTCEMEFVTQTIQGGIGSILFLFNSLEFCIALSTSIFGCKTVCRTSYSDVAVVIYQNTSVNEAKPALSADEEVKMH